MVKFIAAPFGNYLKLHMCTSITGSWTALYRRGRYVQVIKTVRYDWLHKGWVNRLGLRNLGIDYALEKHNEKEVLSIAAINKNDWAILNSKIPRHYNIEINLSCPNVAEVGIGNNIRDLLDSQRQWCIAKVSPIGCTNLVDKLVELGFTQIHASNTLPSSRGGLSGISVKPYSIKIIEYIKRTHSHIEVIGGGGINTVQDITDYRNAGADHVSFASVCFTPWRLPSLIAV